MPKRAALAKALAELMQHHALELQDALDAHIEWKRALRDAVVRGYFEQGSDDAGRDDLCALGRWLNSLPAETMGDSSFDDAAELHARFHREAALVVQYLEMGRIDEAREAMAPESGFDRASGQLIALLEAWQAAA